MKFPETLRPLARKARFTRTPRLAQKKEEKASFAKGLFLGTVLSERVFPFPTAPESEQEFLKMTLDSFQKLAKEVVPAEIEAEKKLPDSLMAKFREMGLFGMVIPEEYGGFGLSNRAYIQILATLGLMDSSITVTLGAHQSIGLKALLMFGTPEQKARFLPRLATGELIAAFGLTEPGAGSDARGLKTTAVLSNDGSHYVLNGNKIWITNGGIADFFTVFARTSHPDTSGEANEKITAFIVTRDMKGFSSGPEEKKMGILGSSTTSIHFEDVKVPLENVIGEPGKGFKLAMEVLNNGRLGLAGACSLGSKQVIQMAIDHATHRKQFGQAIAHFGLIQSKIARLAADNFAAEAMVQVTASLMDQGGHDYSVETAMCKVFCTELQWRAVNEALQIAGGSGYMKEYGYEKLLRDARIFMIWEGTNEILRLFIGLSGVQGPGEKLKEVSNTLKEPLTDVLHSMGVLRDFGVRWIHRRVGNPNHLEGIHPKFHSERRVFAKYTALFAASTEMLLLRRGKKIVKDEYSVSRLADIAIDLYAMACSLSRATHIIGEKGIEQSQLEIELVKTFVRKARRRIAENLRRMEKNDDGLETSIAETLYERGGFSSFGAFT